MKPNKLTKIKKKDINEFRDWLRDRYDHYTPYRPLTDSKEAMMIREELIKIIEEFNKKFGDEE